MRSTMQSKQSLYRVYVETTEGESIPVGPAMIKGACEQFSQSITEQISLGREKTWSNPHILPVLME